MHNVIDETKIDSLVMSYEHTEELIHTGSDEHLDLILELQKSIKELTELSIGVNEELEQYFNTLNEEQARALVIKLSGGLRKAKHFVIILRSLPRELADGIKTCRKELYYETKQIDEFVQDIIKFKINDPKELRELLKEAN